jgi:hypothetical protein
VPYCTWVFEWCLPAILAEDELVLPVVRDTCYDSATRRAGTRSLESIAPAKNTLRSCNNHVTISFSCGVLEVLQHHLRPLSSCKAAKGGYFHGGNTGFSTEGVHSRLVCRKLPFGKVIICRCEGENNSDTLGACREGDKDSREKGTTAECESRVMAGLKVKV